MLGLRKRDTSRAPMSIRCKPKHRPLRADQPASVRSRADRKSTCPGWASDAALRERLERNALIDGEAGEDSYGRPRRIWNAVAGTVFVGVSTNEQEPHYNCYPEVPATSLADELAERAERSVEDVRLERSSIHWTKALRLASILRRAALPR